MASIRKEMVVGAEPESIWEAMRDVGAVHGGWLRASSSTAGSRKTAGPGWSPSPTAWWRAS